MKSRKLFTRQKAKNGEGRQAVIKHLLLPEEVIKELRMYKDAYSVCLAREKDQWGNPIPVQVTWEQMLRRWMDNIGRFDKDIKEYVESGKAYLEANPPAPTFPVEPTEGEIWEMRKHERDSNELDAIPGDLTPFYAGKKGFEVAGEYVEHGSGTMEDRPELLRCMEVLKRGGCSILLVSEISRLGRTVKDVVNTIDEMTKVGINIYVQDINLWTLLPDGSENPMAKVVLTILALGAEMERKSIVSRLNSGRERAKEKGVKMGRPEGTRMSDKDLLAKYPEVAKKIRKGHSIREVSKLCGVSSSTVQKVKKIIM